MDRNTRHSPLFKTPHSPNRVPGLGSGGPGSPALKILTALLFLAFVVQVYHNRAWFADIPDVAAPRKQQAAPAPVKAKDSLALEKPAAPAEPLKKKSAKKKKPGFFGSIVSAFTPKPKVERDEIFDLDDPLDSLFREFGVDRSDIVRKIENFPKYYIEERVRLPRGKPLPEYVLALRKLAESRGLTLSDAFEAPKDSAVTLEISGRTKVVRRQTLSYGGRFLPGYARIAFVVEGLGPDLTPEIIRLFSELKRPVTIGIVPFSPHAGKIRELAQRNGFEVLCQIPMETVPYRPLGDHALYKHFDPPKVDKTLFETAEFLPEARGYAIFGGGVRILENEPEILKRVLSFVRHEEKYFIDNSFASRSRAPEFAKTLEMQFMTPLGAADRGAGKPKEEILRYAAMVRKTGAGIVLFRSPAGAAAVLNEAFPEIEKESIKIVTVSSLFK